VHKEASLLAVGESSAVIECGAQIKLIRRLAISGELFASGCEVLDHWYGLLAEPLGVCAERE
jgi:hypothetical protein